MVHAVNVLIQCQDADYAVHKAAMARLKQAYSNVSLEEARKIDRQNMLEG